MAPRGTEWATESAGIQRGGPELLPAGFELPDLVYAQAVGATAGIIGKGKGEAVGNRGKNGEQPKPAPVPQIVG